MAEVTSGSGSGFKISQALLIFLVLQGATVIWGAAAIKNGLGEVEKDIADLKVIVRPMVATDREQDVKIKHLESLIADLSRSVSQSGSGSASH